jgi:predicted metal-dependent phosphotriesterase family hydrolase
MAVEQVEILRQERADLTRIVIGHMDIHPDLDYVCQVARTGVNIAFDTVGKQNWDYFLEPEASDRPDGEVSKKGYHKSDSTRAKRLAALIADGFEDQILLAQDLTGVEVSMKPTTHGQWGVQLPRRFVHDPIGRTGCLRGADREDDAGQSCPAAGGQHAGLNTSRRVAP